jgi:hypothetical protein
MFMGNLVLYHQEVESNSLNLKLGGFVTCYNQ